MNSYRLAAAAAVTLTALSSTLHAAPLPGDGTWGEFSVDDTRSASFGVEWIAPADFFPASPLHFTFSIAPGFKGTLTVVDAGFSGDQFRVMDNAAVLGTTSVGVDGDPTGAITVSYDDALANPDFSRGVYMLAAGNHDVTGVLSRSLSFGGAPLNSTIGALRLEVSAVPEPASVVTLLAGLSLLAVVLRRRGDSK